MTRIWFMTLVVCLIDCFISDRLVDGDNSLITCRHQWGSSRGPEGAQRGLLRQEKIKNGARYQSVNVCVHVWVFSRLQDINFRLVFMLLDIICPDTSALREPRPNGESHLAPSCRDMRPAFAAASRSFKFCFLWIGLTSGFFFLMFERLLGAKFILLQHNDPQFLFRTSKY